MSIPAPRYPVFLLLPDGPLLGLRVWVESTVTQPTEQYTLPRLPGESRDALMVRAQAKAFEVHGRSRYTRTINIRALSGARELERGDEWANTRHRLLHVLKQSEDSDELLAATQAMGELHGWFPRAPVQ